MKKTKGQIIEHIKDFLFPIDEISFALIFGSFVDKDFYHDIDIAIYINNSFNYQDLNKFPYGYTSSLESSLSYILRENVDLLLLNDANLLIQKKVVDKRIIVFEKNKTLRVEFENLIRKRFIDFIYLRKSNLFHNNNKFRYA
ncbi:MAG: nucleotidyltransferase domain-containing protein [Ignavibacterium sp.]|nr:nucleotidyltransferase domain-containing protein [Ignavibacterium sp.]MDW8376264.1 hypothetical protein [Ignavibacteriales bacterium]